MVSLFYERISSGLEFKRVSVSVSFRCQSSIFALFVFPFNKFEMQPQLSKLTPGNRRPNLNLISER
jgi:hypothetical protein